MFYSHSHVLEVDANVIERNNAGGSLIVEPVTEPQADDVGANSRAHAISTIGGQTLWQTELSHGMVKAISHRLGLRGAELEYFAEQKKQADPSPTPLRHQDDPEPPTPS